jgi:hypothetical protein
MTLQYVYDIKTDNIIQIPYDIVNTDTKRYYVLDLETVQKFVNNNYKHIIKTIGKGTSKKSYMRYIHVCIDKLDMTYLKDIANYYGSLTGDGAYYNPQGLWISCGTSWIDFLKPTKDNKNVQINAWTLSTYIYEIKINDTNILKINNLDEFKEFIYKYRFNDKNVNIRNVMDWKRIKNDYSGIVICPYLGDLLFGKNANAIGLTGSPENITNFYRKLIGPSYYDHILFLSEWYRHWEASTGVIWNLAGIKDIVLLDKSAVYPRILKVCGRKKEVVNEKNRIF